MEFSTETENKIKEMSERSKIPIDKLKEKWTQYFNHYRNDGQFQSDESCNDYILQIFLGRYVLRPPVKQYTFIPIGYSSITQTKKGVRQANLFFVDTNRKLCNVLMRGDATSQLKKITLFKLYKDIDLGQISDDTLAADDRAEFTTPYDVDTPPNKFIEILQIPKTTIKEAHNNQSKKGSDGYVVRTDWKCVRGVIKSIRTSLPEDEKQWGFLTLVDRSIEHDEPTVQPDGRLVNPGFDVSISPYLCQYPVDSEVDIFGTVETDAKTSKPTMRGYCILPVHIATFGVQ